MTKRISSLPSFLSCPSSALATKHPYDPPSEMGSMGDAVHAAMAKHVLGLLADIPAIAKNYGIDADELESLFRAGVSAWSQVERHFPNARTEEPLDGGLIVGTADVFANDGSTMAILDWKSNRVKLPYRAQVLGYVAAATAQYGWPESGEVVAALVWLRFGDLDVWRFNRADVDGLHNALKRAERDVGKVYAPGEPCHYCRRQLVCGARHDLLESARSSIVAASGVKVTPSILGALYPKARMLKRALGQYDDALKIALREGPLSDGEGNTLELAEEPRDTIDAEVAWPVLIESGLTDTQLAECVKLGKTRLLSTYTSGMKRGTKGPAKARLMARLAEAGAIKRGTVEILRCRKTGGENG